MTTTTRPTYSATDHIQTIGFGLEIETTGLSRERVAQAIQSVVGGTLGFEYSYSRHTVTAPDGRKWSACSDASINGDGAEFVTPALRYSDMDTLQNVIRAIRRAGARVDTSCGVHVHVDASSPSGVSTAAELKKLAKLVYSNEELLILSLDVEERVRPNYRRSWCRPTNENFVARVARRNSANTVDGVVADYYATTGATAGLPESSRHRYDDSRYQILNLHAIRRHGTVEFRLFNATLHAGKIKSYIQLVLAMAAKAKTGRHTAAKKRALDPNRTRYAMRSLMLRLGMSGDEFKTARLHLVTKARRLTGHTAFGTEASESRGRNNGAE